jgi:hypothetical protein
VDRLLSRLCAVALAVAVLLMDGVLVAVIWRIGEGYVVLGGMILGLTVVGLAAAREFWVHGV